MNSFKVRIENTFARLTRWIYRRHWVVLFAALIFMAWFAFQLPNLVVDTSNEGMLHANDPTLIKYNEFRDLFGSDGVVMIALKPPRVFDADFLEKLKAIHEDLAANVPHVREVLSLINARSTVGRGDTLIVGDLMEDWPTTEEDIQAFRQRVMSNPLYINQLISADGAYTNIMVRMETYSSQGKDTVTDAEALTGFDDETAPPSPEKPPYLTNEEITALIQGVETVMARHRHPEIAAYMAGAPAVAEILKQNLIKDIILSIQLALTMIIICLFTLFRRLSGVVFPLTIVIMALVCTLGLMAVLDKAVKLPTMILPAFLMAVGVGDSVHVLTLFYRRYRNREDKEEAIVHAMTRSGLALVMTSLTTAAGLASFSTAEIAPIADMGLFASYGVILALILTIFLLPALLAAVPITPRNFQRLGQTPVMDRLLHWVGSFSTARPRLILTISLVLLLASGAGAARLRFSHNVLLWLPPDLPIRVATEEVDRTMKGTVVLEVMVDTGREKGLYDPEILKKLDHIAQNLETTRHGDLFVGQTTSVVDILKEIHQALNENRPEFYAIPDQAALIPQEFLLFENSGSDDLEDVVDPHFQTARFTARVPWGDAITYVPFIMEVEKLFKEELGPDVDITVTGIMTLFTRAVSAAIHSAAKSYVIAFIVITIMMVMLIGRLRLGLLAMLPNLTPIMITLGFMGWAGLPLDMVTMLTGSIAIGLAVDDTVHFMHHFDRNYGRTGNAKEAVHETLDTAGRAMLVTTIVLCLGFLILVFTSMRNIVLFGVLTGLTLLVALAADYFLAPALIMLTHKRS